MQDRFIKRFNFKNIEEAHKIQGFIAEIERYQGMWTATTTLSPQILTMLKKSTIITSAGASTRIEGSKLTDEEIEKLFKNGLKIKKFSTRDEQEVAGYKELLENVFEAWKTIKFSENTIKHFHKELLKYSDKDQGHLGNYKYGENKVVAYDHNGKVVGIIFEPTSPYLTPFEMSELVEWTQKALAEKMIHPLLIIGNFILEFLAVHPFQDGNGRTSRILTNLLLLKTGYDFAPYVSHEKFIEDNKDIYYLALNKSQKSLKTDESNIVPWLLFFLEIIRNQAKMAVELSQKEKIEALLSEKQLAVWYFILEKKETTPKEIREALKIPTVTVLQVLNKLLDMKKIERLSAGRSTRYRVK
ncbi:MAG: Fic family protein [Candidatus Falkowbacteria bacterium]|nr:Fic family protein [Candidatus Falkowbacteria bacterium]